MGRGQSFTEAVVAEEHPLHTRRRGVGSARLHTVAARFPTSEHNEQLLAWLAGNPQRWEQFPRFQGTEKSYLLCTFYRSRSWQHPDGFKGSLNIGLIGYEATAHGLAYQAVLDSDSSRLLPWQSLGISEGLESVIAKALEYLVLSGWKAPKGWERPSWETLISQL